MDLGFRNKSTIILLRFQFILYNLYTMNPFYNNVLKTLVIVLVSITASCDEFSDKGSSGGGSKEMSQKISSNVLFMSGPNDMAEVELSLKINGRFEMKIKDLEDESLSTLIGSVVETKENYILNFDKSVDLESLFDYENRNKVEIISDSQVAIKKVAGEINIYGIACTRY
jgi:hypothetical protein